MLHVFCMQPTAESNEDKNRIDLTLWPLAVRPEAAVSYIFVLMPTIFIDENNQKSGYDVQNCKIKGSISARKKHLRLPSLYMR